MARIDHADSTVGTVRGTLGVDIDAKFNDKLVAVGVTNLGRLAPGAANTGVVGIMQPGKKTRLAGTRVDYFKLGDFIDLNDPDMGLVTGRVAYADNGTGEITTPAAAPAAGTATRVGHTIDTGDKIRLVIDIKIGA